MEPEAILTFFAVVAGVVAVLELLEYLFERNIPWLARLLTRLWRWGRRKLGLVKPAPGQRFLALNFSAHPLLPGQCREIQRLMGWPKLEVLGAELGNVAEGQAFTAEVIGCLDKIDLTPLEWQSQQLVVVAAGYAPAWSVVLAELHGRLGYFPDLVRLRPAPAKAGEKFEVAEIVSLREIRNRARSKRV
ncbi:MAG: hypothetical protein KJ077_22320 [Anaerolineae bacterium]|nr:hypothetical protein [Anaerolineae bacterium]